MTTVTGTYNTVQNIRLTIRFNEPTTIPGSGNPSSQNYVATVPGYYAAVIVTDMQAVDTLGGIRDIQSITPVGAARATIFTPQELATLVQGSNNSTGTALLTELTNAYTRAIGGIS